MSNISGEEMIRPQRDAPLNRFKQQGLLRVCRDNSSGAAALSWVSPSVDAGDVASSHVRNNLKAAADIDD